MPLMLASLGARASRPPISRDRQRSRDSDATLSDRYTSGVLFRASELTLVRSQTRSACVFILALLLVACGSDQALQKRATAEPWFHTIRVVNGANADRCRPLGVVTTIFDPARANPPIPPSEYRQTRRAAFDIFEQQVVSRGGNAVRLLRFAESGSPGSPFLLTMMKLSGDALRCE
ncbi:MAG TPA: hypothetical protein VLC46_27425 [Thermoanaerobaculia bacterium]|nr:hypothetical protein [Thermoanaerobaculia bacterium]